MKGLQETLRERIEQRNRIEKHDISEEAMEANSLVMAKLTKGCFVHIEYYCAFHDVSKDGRITEISVPFRYLRLDNEKIFFDDIYAIQIIA